MLLQLYSVKHGQKYIRLFSFIPVLSFLLELLLLLDIPLMHLIIETFIVPKKKGNPTISNIECNI